MNRRRAIAVCVVSLACGACSLVLGIDGEVIGRGLPEGGDEGRLDAGPPALVVDAPPPLLLQGGTVDVRVRRAAGRPGETTDVTLINVPPGVAVKEPPAKLAEGETVTITLVAAANASLGLHKVGLVGSDVTPGQVSVDVTIAGNLDTTFGDGGIAVIPFAGTPASFENFGLSVDPASGDIYVAFARDLSIERTAASVARAHEDGTLDLSFAANGFSTLKASFELSQGRAVFSDLDGGLVVFGDGIGFDAGDELPPRPFTTTYPAGTERRLTIPGDDDDIASTVNVVRHQDGGLLSLTTRTGAGDPPPPPLLSRTDGQGAPDNTFFGINKTFLPIPELVEGGDLVLVEGGKILVFGAALGIERFDTTVTRRLPKGAVDTSFGDGGVARENLPRRNTAHAGAVEDGGTVLFAGEIVSRQGGENTLMRIGRLDDRGQTVTAFGDGGTVVVGGPDPERPGAKARAVLPLANGKFLVTGALENLDNDTIPARVVVARFQQSGAIDTDFGLKGFSLVDLGARSDGRRMAWQKDKVIVAALVNTTGGASNVVLMRYTP